MSSVVKWDLYSVSEMVEMSVGMKALMRVVWLVDGMAAVKADDLVAWKVVGKAEMMVANWVHHSADKMAEKMAAMTALM